MFRTLPRLALLMMMLTALAACQKGSSFTTRLSGSITGMDLDTVYLYGTDGLFTSLDTIEVSDGKLSTSFNVDTLTMIYLQTRDGYRHPLFVDKDMDIRIQGDISSLSTLQVSGSQDNELLSAFLKEHEQDLEDDEAMARHTEAFVKENFASAASVYLIQRYLIQSIQPDIDRIAEAVKNLDVELQDWNIIADFTTLYTNQKELKKGGNSVYFRIKDIKGEMVSRITAYRNQPVLLYFWASWSPESRALHEQYKELLKSLKGDAKVGIIGVCLDTDVDDCKKAVQKDGIDWIQICDGKGWLGDLPTKYHVTDLPRQFLMDKDGFFTAIDPSGNEEILEILEGKTKEDEKEDVKQSIDAERRI